MGMPAGVCGRGWVRRYAAGLGGGVGGKPAWVGKPSGREEMRKPARHTAHKRGTEVWAAVAGRTTRSVRGE
jgi:hypothetical protein